MQSLAVLLTVNERIVNTFIHTEWLSYSCESYATGLMPACVVQVILMDHVDWLHEAAASQLASRLSDQVPPRSAVHVAKLLQPLVTSFLHVLE